MQLRALGCFCILSKYIDGGNSLSKARNKVRKVAYGGNKSIHKAWLTDARLHRAPDMMREEGKRENFNDGSMMDKSNADS